MATKIGRAQRRLNLAREDKGWFPPILLPLLGLSLGPNVVGVGFTSPILASSEH